jgi:hypothetical protein
VEAVAEALARSAEPLAKSEIRFFEGLPELQMS